MTQANAGSYKLEIVFFCTEKLVEPMSSEEILEEIPKSYQSIDAATDFVETLQYNEKRKVFVATAHMNRLKGLMNKQKKQGEVITQLINEKNSFKENNTKLEQSIKDLNQELKSTKSNLEQITTEFGDYAQISQKLSEARVKSELYQDLKDIHSELKERMGEYKEFTKKVNKELKEKVEKLEEKLTELRESSDVLKENCEKMKTELRVCKRSLLLCYKKYATLPSRKLLSFLSTVVYEAHGENGQAKKGDIKCDCLQSSLAYAWNNECDEYACLHHFLACPLSSGNLGNILPVEILLNKFDTTATTLNEIVISGEHFQAVQHFQILNKVLHYLKENFPQNDDVKNLPVAVLSMNSLKSLEELACYKLAKNQIENDL